MTVTLEITVPCKWSKWRTPAESEQHIIDSLWERMEYFPPEITTMLKDNFKLLNVNVEKEIVTFTTELLETRDEFLTIFKMST